MKKKIESIQALRALAASLVVFVHAQHQVLGYKDRGAGDAFFNSDPTMLLFGEVGVDIFFVISGVVMTLTVWNLFSSPNQAGIFLKKRAIRIFPVYWFYLLLLVILHAFFSKYMTYQPVFNPEKALISALLIPYNGEAVTAFHQHYTLGVAWSLSFEMYFYFIVAGCLFLPRKFFFPIVSAVLLGGMYFLKPYTSVHPIFFVFSGHVLIEFLYGILIGYALKTKRCAPASLALLLILAAPILLFMGKAGYFPLQHGISIGVPSAMLVFGIVSLEQSGKLRIPAILTKLGDSSYTLYLCHGFVLLCLGKPLSMAGLLPVIPADILIVVMAAVCLPAGYIAYLLVEKPLTAFLNNKLVYKEPEQRTVVLQTVVPVPAAERVSTGGR